MVSRRKSESAAYDPRSVQEHIVETPLGEEMSKSFLEYAYSVIYARALPDARDGLKPVQRRIVYQMGQMNLLPTRPYMKSARVVGEVMGKLHPHGDSAIYEAMVRLAQPFAMRLPLVDGHGNFGSLDDGPAASRYTEARLAPAALGMNANINEDTVDFVPNYDNKLKEPAVLPAAIPNLLVNGASGIAVGMATNMATHNLGEVVAAAKYVMKHPDASLDDLMQYVPGPDWPSGGIIIGRNGIRDAYREGRGTLTTRSATHVENVTARKKAIVVTELPYMVGPERVLERISDGVKNHKLEGISNAIDLTDRHNGTRIVIELKTGFDPAAVLSQLFKHTPLQENFTMNNVALVDGRPHTMGLREMLDVWIAHRRSVIRRRSEYRHAQALDRLHLVEGLLLALVDIDEVIQVIRSSENADTAKTKLMTVFDLDEIQAQYILDLRLRRLTKMSRIELESERDELRATIAQLEAMLSSQDALDAVVIREMDEAVAQYGEPRRTVLLDEQEDGTLTPVSIHADDTLSDFAQQAAASAARISNAAADVAAAQKTAGIADAAAALQIEDEPCVIALSASGRIARLKPEAQEIWNQRASGTIESADQFITHMMPSTTRGSYALITSAGRFVLAQSVELPEVACTNPLNLATGVPAAELIAHTEHTDPVEGEQVIALVATDSEIPVALGTAHGVIKRWNRQSPTTMDSWSIIDLKDDDRVLVASEAPDDAHIVFITSDASLLTYAASLVRPQGRTAGGMAGIRVGDESHVVTCAIVPADQVAWQEAQVDDEGAIITPAHGAVVLTVAGDTDSLLGTENGSAKLTPLAQYPTKGRATGGVRSQRFLKGQNTIIQAFVGAYPLMAATEHGHSVDLPQIDMRRDGSGTELSASIAYLA